MMYNSKINSIVSFGFLKHRQVSEDCYQVKIHDFFTKQTLVTDLECHFSLTTVTSQAVLNNYYSISRVVFCYLISTVLEFGEEFEDYEG